MSVKVEDVVKAWEESSAIALDVAKALENNKPADLAMAMIKHLIQAEVAVKLTKAYAENKIKGQ